MKTKRIAQFLFVSLWLVVACGCEDTPAQQAERLVTPLPKLTSAVQAIVRYPDPANPVPDDRLVAEAIKDKPELQRAFEGYPIKVRHDSQNVVILVCSPDGKWAWLEDASWTLGVDHKWYLVKPPMPAEFTMDPARKGNTESNNAPLEQSKKVYHAKPVDRTDRCQPDRKDRPGYGLHVEPGFVG